MRPRNVSKGINHGEDDQAEGKRNPNMGDTSARDFVNHDRAGPCEDQGEGSETFSSEFFRHPDLHHRGLQTDFFAPLLNLRPDFVANDPDLFEFCGLAALHF